MQETLLRSTSTFVTEPEVNFSDVFSVIWARRWIVICITLLGTSAAGVAALTVEKEYTASVMISPVSNSGSGGQMGGGLSNFASQFGGLAALAGVSVGGDSKKSENLAVLQSESLTEQYIQQNNLLPVLFKKQWDAVEKKWRTSDPTKIPTLWKANVFFKKKVRTVFTDAKTGLVTLSIEWNDPNLAAEWANGLVRLANNYLRDRAIRESELNITYLTEQASKTDVLAVKQAVYSLLQNEIEKSMLARGNGEYALRVVDSAFVPETPSSPRLSLWVLVGFASGLFVSMAIVFALNIVKPPRQPS